MPKMFKQNCVFLSYLNWTSGDSVTYLHPFPTDLKYKIRIRWKWILTSSVTSMIHWLPALLPWKEVTAASPFTPDFRCQCGICNLRVYACVFQLGKMRMTVPCRASTCNHLQCYDATTYLMMNEKKPTWLCPVCDRPAEFGKLAIDGSVIVAVDNITAVFIAIFWTLVCFHCTWTCSPAYNKLGFLRVAKNWQKSDVCWSWKFMKTYSYSSEHWWKVQLVVWMMWIEVWVDTSVVE